MMTQEYLKHLQNVTLLKGVNNAPLGWYGAYTIEIVFQFLAPLKSRPYLINYNFLFLNLISPLE